MRNRHERAAELDPDLGVVLALIPIAFGTGVLGLWLYTWSFWHSFGAADSSMTSLGVEVVWVALTLWTLVPVVLLFGGALLAWRRRIRWTRGRKALVGVMGVLLILATVAPLFFTPSTALGGMELVFAITVGPLMAGAALLLVARFCIDTPAMPAVPGEALPCWTCGYDLRGQCECRCPECGTQYKVGELIRGLRMEE